MFTQNFLFLADLMFLADLKRSVPGKVQRIGILGVQREREKVRRGGKKRD
jgi:hypothetical protein